MFTRLLSSSRFFGLQSCYSDQNGGKNACGIEKFPLLALFSASVPLTWTWLNIVESVIYIDTCLRSALVGSVLYSVPRRGPSSGELSHEHDL